MRERVSHRRDTTDYQRLSKIKKLQDSESSKESRKQSRLKELHENMLNKLKKDLEIVNDPLEIDRIKDAIKYQEKILESLEKIKE
jgi:hypothetical protein